MQTLNQIKWIQKFLLNWNFLIKSPVATNERFTMYRPDVHNFLNLLNNPLSCRNMLIEHMFENDVLYIG